MPRGEVTLMNTPVRVDELGISGYFWKQTTLFTMIYPLRILVERHEPGVPKIKIIKDNSLNFR